MTNALATRTIAASAAPLTASRGGRARSRRGEHRPDGDDEERPGDEHEPGAAEGQPRPGRRLEHDDRVARSTAGTSERDDRGHEGEAEAEHPGRRRSGGAHSTMSRRKALATVASRG